MRCVVPKYDLVNNYSFKAKQNLTFIWSVDLLGMSILGRIWQFAARILLLSTRGHYRSSIHPGRGYSFTSNFHCHFRNISSFCPLPSLSLSLSLSSGIVCPSSDISRGFFRLSLPSFRFPEDKKRQWFFGEIGGNPTHSWFDLVSKERE